MKRIVLNNKIEACIKQNKNTPRIALTLNIAINKPEKHAGQYSLMNRLLLKGTQKYTAEELSTILDENAIDLYTEMKSDYLRFKFVCLNEDFELALSLLNDIIHNSTFTEFEKEKVKLKGELIAELDSAKLKISDLFTKTIYENHYYGNSCTVVLEQVDNVTQNIVRETYQEIISTGRKTIALVGDVSNEEEILNKYFGSLKNDVSLSSEIPEINSIEHKYAELIKDDANQAQILQGWVVPTIGHEDYPKLILLNVILGASGLSSRLFLELREKKGLAYTVRSAYEIHFKTAAFTIYIGTEPSNIQTSIDGFKQEIDKIKTILVSEEELNNAKNNWIGKQQFITETNSQQANLLAYYSIAGKGFDYQDAVIDAVKKVTPEEIKECANKYFNENFVLAVLKP